MYGCPPQTLSNMEKLNNATKARGVILVVICIILTVLGGQFMMDQPITEQTADFLRMRDLRFAAYLSAFLISTTLSMVITFFIGIMIPGADLESTKGFTSNPASKAICYIGFATWVIGIIGGLISQLFN